MRRVDRDEAGQLLREERPGAAVHEVIVGQIRPDLRDRQVPGAQEPPDVHEYAYTDGGGYSWSWATPQLIRAGSRLWCTTPVDDEGGLGADQELLPVGVITSGLFSPTLGDAIAMALLDPRVARVGTDVVVDVRGRPQAATVTGVSNSGSLRFLPSHH